MWEANTNGGHRRFPRELPVCWHRRAGDLETVVALAVHRASVAGGLSPPKLIASRIPFLALPVHKQHSLTHGGWFMVHHVTVLSREEVCSQGVCIPGVACCPAWLASAEGAAL